MRKHKNRIADDAAKPVGKGHVRRLRQQGSEARRQYAADRPEKQPGLDPLQPPRREQPPSPKARRNDEANDAKAQHLHEEVSGDGPARTEEIADHAGGRMIEAWILDRPGQEAQA